MKIFRIWLVVCLVTILPISPILGSLAQAGSINYKGISSVTVEDEYGMQLHRGLTLNFSFGGPKDYRQKKSVQDIQEANLDSAKLEAYGVLIVAIGIGILTWTE